MSEFLFTQWFSELMWFIPCCQNYKFSNASKTLKIGVGRGKIIFVPEKKKIKDKRKQNNSWGRETFLYLIYHLKVVYMVKH